MLDKKADENRFLSLPRWSIIVIRSLTSLTSLLSMELIGLAPHLTYESRPLGYRSLSIMLRYRLVASVSVPLVELSKVAIESFLLAHMELKLSQECIDNVGYRRQAKND